MTLFINVPSDALTEKKCSFQKNNLERLRPCEILKANLHKKKLNAATETANFKRTLQVINLDWMTF